MSIKLNHLTSGIAIKIEDQLCRRTHPENYGSSVSLLDPYGIEDRPAAEEPETVVTFEIFVPDARARNA